MAELAPIVETVKDYRSIVAEIAGLEAMLEDPATDAEMRQMAAAEKPALENRRTALEQRIKLVLLPKDAMDDRNVILEGLPGSNDHNAGRLLLGPDGELWYSIGDQGPAWVGQGGDEAAQRTAPDRRTVAGQPHQRTRSWEHVGRLPHCRPDGISEPRQFRDQRASDES